MSQFGGGVGSFGKVASTSDERTVNNVFRHEYKVLTNEEKVHMKAIKDKGLEFYSLISSRFDGRPDRESRIAQERVEEAVMWAVKSLTK